MHSLSVVIRCEGRGALGYCLQSVLGQTVAAAEVVVVDGTGLDGYEPLVAPFTARGVRYCRVGICSPLLAVARGVEQLRGDIVCCLAPDDTISPRYFERGLPHFADPQVGIVYPRLASSPRTEPAGRFGIDYSALVRRAAVLQTAALRTSAAENESQCWCRWEALQAAGYLALEQEEICYTARALAPAPSQFRFTEILSEELFDEEYYLNANADVRAAVRRGIYRSGHEHYTLFGKGERRSARIKQP